MSSKGGLALARGNAPRSGARSWRRPDAGMNIVKDVTGTLSASRDVVVPFALNDADFECLVVLLTDVPAVHLSLQAPSGALLSPEKAAASGLNYCDTGGTRSYRFHLPLDHEPRGGAGTWKAILRRDENEPMQDPIAYDFSVMAWSTLRLRASIARDRTQRDLLTLRAFLDESGAPVAEGAGVRAEMIRPDGSRGVLVFRETEPGTFEASVEASLLGTYRFDLIASGVTASGLPFTRQELLTQDVRRRGTPRDGGSSSDVIESPANDATSYSRALFWVCGGSSSTSTAA
jgi:hypothetical protein